MSLQHQSYLKLKKYVGEECARKAPLYSLESLKENVRATARAMRCSPHTVYLALEKGKKRNLRDSSYKPKSKHPHCVDTEKEQMAINYRKKSRSGKNLRYVLQCGPGAYRVDILLSISGSETSWG